MIGILFVLRVEAKNVKISTSVLNVKNGLKKFLISISNTKSLEG